MKSKHIKSKKTKYFSLIIVPDSKSVKQIKLATWVPKSIISLVLMLTLSTGYLLYNYLELQKNYSSNLDTLSEITVKNSQQKSEIDTLKQKTSAIEEKLKSVLVLQETIENMVGLKQQNTSTITSRSNENINRNNILSTNNLSDVEKQINELSNLIDQSEVNLNNLIGDVETRLKYLDAKPNLTPAPGRISSGFGYRTNPFGQNREFHNGIDISNNYNTKIIAAGSGIVTYSGYNGSFGRVIVISHGYGYQSIYGHNNKLLVKVGDKVAKGQNISLMGSSGRSTGPHVHFEIRLYGKAIDPRSVLNNNK